MVATDVRTQFEQNLDSAFAESEHELAMQNRRESAEYARLCRESRELMKKIQEMLGDDRSLLLRLEEKVNHMRSIDDDLIYLQGHRDCVTLLRKVGVL